MFWLSRPPYVRWALAAAVVLTGVFVEFRPPTTVPHPFAEFQIAIGEVVDDTSVMWRDVPVGLLAPVRLPLVSDRRIGVGEPVLGGNGAEDVSSIPDGWWAIEVDIPDGTRSGSTVRLVTATGVADGVVVDVREGDFGERTALVAVPEAAISMVAAAVLDATMAVLVGG
ncbi:MAG TPA: hypothetical protein VMS74_09345 [Acidimicrobiia bacterium]|nr:hypothetical protein [Acidimicrobiia bacterium]